MRQIYGWDVLLCLDASRLARDEDDFGWILNQLEEHGRTGFAASTRRELSSFGTRIMGVVNAEERRMLEVEPKRGRQGRGGAPNLRDVCVGARTRGDRARVRQRRVAATAPPGSRRGRRPSWAPTAIRAMLRTAPRRARVEPERVAGELARIRAHLATAEEVLPRLWEMLRRVEATIRSNTALGRMVNGGLLGEERIRIYPDGRIEGLATLRPEMQVAAPEALPKAATLCGSRVLRPRVAALPVAVSLPIGGQIAIRAA